MLLSLCLITKNEEKNLDRLLNSIYKEVDEIIIVDTGSTDNTIEISKKFTKKVFNFIWNDDFSAARNFSIEKAKSNWILVLDPDEEIELQDIKKLKQLTKEADNDTLGFRLIQETYHDNKKIMTRGICRLFRNKKEIRFTYPVHETVRESIKQLNGKIGKTGIVIKHYLRLSKEKSDYYLKLLEKKKNEFPDSNYKKETEIEKSLI